MGISSCFLTPLKTLCLACTAASMTTSMTSFSHYIDYLFVAISFIVSLTTNSTEGERKSWFSYLFQHGRWKHVGEVIKQEEKAFFPSLWFYFFKAHFALFFFLVLVCILIQPMNIHMICNVLEKMKLFMFKKICVGVQNFSKKRALFLHWFRLLMKTFDPFLLDLFFFWKCFLFLPRRCKNRYLSPITFYLFLKKYILVISLIYSLLGQIVEQYLNLDIGSYVFLWFSISTAEKHF